MGGGCARADAFVGFQAYLLSDNLYNTVAHFSSFFCVRNCVYLIHQTIVVQNGEFVFSEVDVKVSLDC